MFHYIKERIKEEILKQHGTISNFIKRFPEKNFSKTKISLLLNGSKNTTLESIESVLECLNMELRLGKRVRDEYEVITVRRKTA